MNNVETAIEAAGFRAFARALSECFYGDVIESGGPYTIFAPTDGAFAKVSKSSLALLEEDAKLLRAVVGYHFAAGKVVAKQFAGRRIRASTYTGETLLITDDGGLHVNKANLVQPDIMIGACVLHGIDGVLWPREHAAATR